MSTKNLAIRGVVFNWLGRGSSLVITFFLTPFLLHTLQEVRYGVWSTVMSFTGYYALADMGLRGASTKYIAQFHAVDDRESINKVVVTSLFVYAGLGLLVAIAAGVVAWLVPSWVPKHIPTSTFRAVIVISGMTVVLRLFSQVFNASLNALQRHDITSALSVISQLATAGLVVASLLAGGGLVEMAWVTLAVAIFAQGTRAFFAIRLLPGLSLSPRHFDRATFNLVFKFGGATMLPRATRQVVQNLANPLIFAMLGPSAVAVYDVPGRILQKVSGLGRSFNTIIMPLASRLEAKGNKEALLQVTSNAARVLLALSASVSVMLICMGRQIINLWIDPAKLAAGAEFTIQAYPLLCLLALALVPRITAMTMRSVLRGTAQFRPLIYVAAVEITIVVILAPLLLYIIGLKGMAIAILVSQLIAGGVLIPYATCRVLDCSITEFVRSIVPRAFLATVPSAITAMLLSNYWQPRRMYELLIELAIIAGFGLISVFFVCLNSSRRQDIISAFLPARPAES